MNARSIEELVTGLTKICVNSKSTLVQTKTKKALAKLKCARTLIEQASRTLAWAEHNAATSDSV